MESPTQKSLFSFIKDLTNWGALLYQNCARIQRFHFIEEMLTFLCAGYKYSPHPVRSAAMPFLDVGVNGSCAPQDLQATYH